MCLGFEINAHYLWDTDTCTSFGLQKVSDTLSTLRSLERGDRSPHCGLSQYLGERDTFTLQRAKIERHGYLSSRIRIVWWF
mmetsp:Transcript_16645/g.30275  ORF Transcript_16645/g.30275 Transcript_16645/m.30275 type:complete len:81 (+) Transcript_16645:390-632(+)